MWNQLWTKKESKMESLDQPRAGGDLCNNFVRFDTAKSFLVRIDFCLWYCNLWTLEKWVYHWLAMWLATSFNSLSFTVLTYKVDVSPTTIRHTAHKQQDSPPHGQHSTPNRSSKSLASPFHPWLFPFTLQDPDCIFFCIPLGCGSLISWLISIYASLTAQWNAPVLTHVAKIRSSFLLLSRHCWHTPPTLCVKIIVFPSWIPCRRGLSFLDLCHGL